MARVLRIRCDRYSIYCQAHSFDDTTLVTVSLKLWTHSKYSIFAAFTTQALLCDRPIRHTDFLQPVVIIYYTWRLLHMHNCCAVSCVRCRNSIVISSDCGVKSNGWNACARTLFARRARRSWSRILFMAYLTWRKAIRHVQPLQLSHMQSTAIYDDWLLSAVPLGCTVAWTDWN